METETKRCRIMFVNDFRSGTTKVIQKGTNKSYETPSENHESERVKTKQERQKSSVCDHNDRLMLINGGKQIFQNSEDKAPRLSCRISEESNSNAYPAKPKATKPYILSQALDICKENENPKTEKETINTKAKFPCSSAFTVTDSNGQVVQKGEDYREKRNRETFGKQISNDFSGNGNTGHKDISYIIEDTSSSENVENNFTKIDNTCPESTLNNTPNDSTEDRYHLKYLQTEEDTKTDSYLTSNIDTKTVCSIHNKLDTLRNCSTQRKFYTGKDCSTQTKCDTKKDCSTQTISDTKTECYTQTDFDYTTLQNQYSIHCEKCGHITTSKDVHFNSANNNTSLTKSEIKCADGKGASLFVKNHSLSSNKVKKETIYNGWNTQETTVTNDTEPPDYKSSERSQSTIKFDINAVSDQLNHALEEFDEECLSFKDSSQQGEHLESHELSEPLENLDLDNKTKRKHEGIHDDGRISYNGNTSDGLHFTESIVGNSSLTPVETRKDKKTTISPRLDDNKSSYKSRRSVINKLPDFAAENFLEVFDVTSDGNCMFSAIVDQLWINGNFSLTHESLRKEAVEFLRKVPTHKDGSHLESFLSGESWGEYLSRMEKIGEWGDQMVLQGISEVTMCRILVINCDLIKTELIPWRTPCSVETLEVLLLGHIGEYHYVSLRPSNWRELWPIKAKTRLLHKRKGSNKDRITFTEISMYDGNPSVDDTAEKIDVNSQLENVDKEPKCEECVEDKTKCPSGVDEISGSDGTDRDLRVTHDRIQLLEEDMLNLKSRNIDLIEKAKATNELYDFKEDQLNYIVTNENSIDPVSSLPIGHFTFYLRQLFELENIHFRLFHTHDQAGIKLLVYGSVGEHLNLFIHGTGNHIIIYPEVLYVKQTKADIVYDIEAAKTPYALLVDMASCQPGFLRLQVLNGNYFENNIELENTLFLVELPIDEYICSGCPRTILTVKQGLECPYWPESLTSEFFTRERPSGWPTSQMLDQLSSRPCHIRKCSHPLSKHPEIEWQFIFPCVEVHLIKCLLNPDMTHVLRVFKLLIDDRTSSSPRRLRTNHIKTVMLLCCEMVPIKVWSTNIGGAILFLVENLMKYLRNRKIPHYIMNSINLLESYTDQEIDSLLTMLEQIRLFPFMSVNVFAETHHVENSWIIKPIMNDLQRFQRDQNYPKSWEETFGPILIKLARMTITNGIDSYLSSLNLLQRSFDKIKKVGEEKPEVCTENFGKYLDRFVYTIDDPVHRYFFSHFIDIHFQTNILNKMITSEGVRRLGDIVEKEWGGRFNAFPIPDGYRMHDMDYLYRFTDYLMMIHELKSAAHYLRCGITMARESIDTEIICIPETADEDIKQQLADKNMTTTRSLNNTLYDLYERLRECYRTMNQYVLFQEFIHDYEQLVIYFDKPCLYRKLATIWGEFGNEEKAQFFQDKARGCGENHLHYHF